MILDEDHEALIEFTCKIQTIIPVIILGFFASTDLFMDLWTVITDCISLKSAKN